MPGHGFDLQRMEACWQIVLHPENTTYADLMLVFFDTRTSAPRRFFDVDVDGARPRRVIPRQNAGPPGSYISLGNEQSVSIPSDEWQRNRGRPDDNLRYGLGQRALDIMNYQMSEEEEMESVGG